MKPVSLDLFLQSLRGDDSDPDKTPSYEGKDPHIQDEPRCTTCRSKPSRHLLCCSRCRTAWYCNSACQKAHYASGHKVICVILDRELKLVEQLAAPLRNARQPESSEPQNLFETQVGSFDKALTQPYMTARRNLMESYCWHAAYVTDVKCVWEKALFHALEILRLNACGPANLLDETVFILLNLNRDDDAFAFIRHWVSIEERLNGLMLRHTQSQEGDWIYPREKNCRFFDVFQEFRYFNDHKVSMSFLVALLIIKLRIVATYDATCSSIDLAFGTTGGQRIQKMQMLVKEMLMDERFVNIESQRQQVERLVHVIHERNATMFPSILNPAPFLANSNRYQDNIRGSTGEALFALLYGTRCLVRVPGAKEMLEQRFGKNPSYNL